MKHRCPTCNKPVIVGHQDKLSGCFPFCSERCKFVDLGKWFDEDYKMVSSKETEIFENDDENTT